MSEEESEASPSEKRRYFIEKIEVKEMKKKVERKDIIKIRNLVEVNNSRFIIH